MLKITQTPFSLVKFHLLSDNIDANNINILHVNNLTELNNCLLEGVSYNKDGELIPSIYLINYIGKPVLKTVKIHSYNTTYLIVENVKKWKHLEKDNNVKFFNIKPSQYAYTINGVAAVLTPPAQRHFWANYCLDKYNCNPYKWYNITRYLFSLYKIKKHKFDINDIDCILNSVSEVVKPYLQNIFTKKGKEYILQMTNKELFVVFVGGGTRRGMIYSYIQRLKPDLLYVYMIFIESFYKGNVRLLDGVILLDFLINSKHKIEQEKVKQLYGM